MSVNDYDELLYEAVQGCLQEGFLDEEEHRDALGVARKVISDGYEGLTPKQRTLYDAVIVPALIKFHAFEEANRVMNSN